MKTRWLAVLAGALLGTGCANDLVGPSRVLDAFDAQARLCGLPAPLLDLSQVGAPHYGTSRATLRVGDRFALRVEGRLDRVTSVRWVVRSPEYAPQPPRLTLTPTSRYGAVLQAVSPGGPEITNWAWVTVELTFADGSEIGAALSVCQRDGWHPAHHIFVVP